MNNLTNKSEQTDKRIIRYENSKYKHKTNKEMNK